jgi:hypothetical protein
MVQEEKHLRVPVVSRQGPPVTEDDRLTGTPVFVEDLSSIPSREFGHSPASLFHSFSIWQCRLEDLLVAGISGWKIAAMKAECAVRRSVKSSLVDSL